MERGMLCFQHCGGRRVFCFQVPELCPACRAPLLQDLSLIPFRIPYPFVKASQYPCALVIKPTNGDYLNEYQPEGELHIGVTSSRGEVLEFDRDGLSVGRPWPDSLLIYQLEAEQREELPWDVVLREVAALDSWTPLRYNEETFNCYTFVLAFLRCLKYPPLSEPAQDKTNFCHMFVTPKVEIAWNYIKLYRRLKDSGYYVSKVNENNENFQIN